MQVKNLILLATLMAFILLGNGRIFYRVIKSGIPIFIYVFCTGIAQLVHFELKNLFMQFVLWIGITFYAGTMIQTKERFFKILDLLIGTAAVVGIFGFIEEITRFNVFSLLNTVGSELNYNPLRLGILRIISFTSHAISYCTYCMLIFALLLYRVEHTEKEKKKKYYVFGIIILANAFLTMSRIALVGIVIELLLFLFFSGRKQFLQKIFKYAVILLILLGVSCIFSSGIRQNVRLMVYTVRAYFDESYAELLKDNGFTDNPRGLGNRVDLYGWVYEEVEDDIWFGVGAATKFEHVFLNAKGYNQIKSSIEVEWLRTLYRYGIIGLIGEIIFMLALLIKSFRLKGDPEEGIGFGKTVFSIVVAYTVVFFGVMQNQDVQAFSVIVILLLAYIQNSGFAKRLPLDGTRVIKNETIGTN